MAKKQKLELTWIGKDNRTKLEPRILLEDAAKSYHAPHKVTENDLFDNQLIFGDNLLALRALEQEYAGKIKCVYIDPPFNTGQAFENYEDGVEHSLWLSLMRDRMKILKNLLTDDGLIFVHIDDNEMAYLTVLMDEIFMRSNRLNVIAVKMSEVSGLKMSHVDKRLPKLKEYILIYKKGGYPKIDVELIPAEEWNDEYKNILVNISKEEIDGLKDLLAKEGVDDADINRCNEILRDAKIQTLTTYFSENSIPKDTQLQFKYDNAWRIIQAVGSSSVFKLALERPPVNQDIGALKSSTGLIYLYKTDFDRSSKQPRVQIIFADDNLMKNPGDFWQDIKTTGGVGQEGGVLFPNGKKPEALIKRIIGMCTQKGDWVLDSFAGSGTTAAVAHKMQRRWITIELKDHCHTHVIPRIKSIIDGNDTSGVTKAVGWKGGGGFRYYYLAPSLLQKDKWDNWVISNEYNAAMLSEAMCKLMGFTYQPNPEHYWIHGHSSESDFIYVTTSVLTHDQLKVISEEVGKNRTLLICCKAFKANQDVFENLTIRKIPAAVLVKCEWGKDNYSLNVANLQSKPEPENKGNGTPSLFDKMQEG
jgi:adenine-specific DNA-methyltransferase